MTHEVGEAELLDAIFSSVFSRKTYFRNLRAEGPRGEAGPRESYSWWERFKLENN